MNDSLQQLHTVHIKQLHTVHIKQLHTVHIINEIEILKGRVKQLMSTTEKLSEIISRIRNNIFCNNPSYEYRHIANNQFSKLKDSIVELMNEGWEPDGEIGKNKEDNFPTEYSQIMRRAK